jgi:hypothetical protein
MGQLSTNNVHFMKFYPMQRKIDSPDSLLQFIQDAGIPSKLCSDDSKDLTKGKLREILSILSKFWIKWTQNEPYSPWQVSAELCIWDIKNAVRNTLEKIGAHKKLWDYCTLYHSEIKNLIPHPHFKLHGQTPYEIETGHKSDISEYLDYTWDLVVWYIDQEVAFPEDDGLECRIGLDKPYATIYFLLLDNPSCILLYSPWPRLRVKILRLSNAYLIKSQSPRNWKEVLPASGQPIVHSTVQPLTKIKSENHDEIIKCIKNLDRSILEKILTLPIQELPANLHDVDGDDYKSYMPIEPEADKLDIDDHMPEECDNLIAAEVLLPKGGELLPATVMSHKHDASGTPIET